MNRKGYQRDGMDRRNLPPMEGAMELVGEAGDIEMLFDVAERKVKAAVVKHHNKVKENAMALIRMLREQKRRSLSQIDGGAGPTNIDLSRYLQGIEQATDFVSSFDLSTAATVQQMTEEITSIGLHDLHIKEGEWTDVVLFSPWATYTPTFCLAIPSLDAEEELHNFAIQTGRNMRRGIVRSYGETQTEPQVMDKVLIQSEGRWYRGQILTTKPQQKLARVRLLDYGNYEDLKFSEIWPHTQELGLNEPPMTLECTLLDEEAMADPRNPKYDTVRWYFNNNMQAIMQRTAGRQGVIKAKFIKQIADTNCWMVDLSVTTERGQIDFSSEVRNKLMADQNKHGINQRDIRVLDKEIAPAETIFLTPTGQENAAAAAAVTPLPAVASSPAAASVTPPPAVAGSPAAASVTPAEAGSPAAASVTPPPAEASSPAAASVTPAEAGSPAAAAVTPPPAEEKTVSSSSNSGSINSSSSSGGGGEGSCSKEKVITVVQQQQQQAAAAAFAFDMKRVKVASELSPDGTFWACNIRSKKEEKEFQAFQGQLRGMFPLGFGIDRNKLRDMCGQVVLAKKTEKDFIRASIVSVKNREVRLIDVDHGRSLKVNYQDMRILDESLLAVPFQATFCRLCTPNTSSATSPTSATSSDHKTSVSFKSELFNQHVTGTICRLNMIREQDGMQYVKLFDENNVSINSRVIGAAHSSSEESWLSDNPLHSDDHSTGATDHSSETATAAAAAAAGGAVLLESWSAKEKVDHWPGHASGHAPGHAPIPSLLDIEVEKTATRVNNSPPSTQHWPATAAVRGNGGNGARRGNGGNGAVRGNGGNGARRGNGGNGSGRGKGGNYAGRGNGRYGAGAGRNGGAKGGRAVFGSDPPPCEICNSTWHRKYECPDRVVYLELRTCVKCQGTGHFDDDCPSARRWKPK